MSVLEMCGKMTPGLASALGVEARIGAELVDVLRRPVWT